MISRSFLPQIATRLSIFVIIFSMPSLTYADKDKDKDKYPFKKAVQNSSRILKTSLQRTRKKVVPPYSVQVIPSSKLKPDVHPKFENLRKVMSDKAKVQKKAEELAAQHGDAGRKADVTIVHSISLNQESKNAGRTPEWGNGAVHEVTTRRDVDGQYARMHSADHEKEQKLRPSPSKPEGVWLMHKNDAHNKTVDQLSTQYQVRSPVDEIGTGVTPVTVKRGTVLQVGPVGNASQWHGRKTDSHSEFGTQIRLKGAPSEAIQNAIFHKDKTKVYRNSDTVDLEK